MSALVLRRRRTAELANGFTPCDTPGCLVRLNGVGQARSSAPSSHLGRSSAVWRVEMVGRLAGMLCERCALEWRRAWAAGGGSQARVDGRRGPAVEGAA